MKMENCAIVEKTENSVEKYENFALFDFL